MKNMEASDNAFANLIEIIVARKIQIIFGFLVVFTITIIGYFTMPPIYSASTKIYVNLPVIPRADIPYVSDLRSFKVFFPNQPQIIKSRKIFEQVVKKLHLDETTSPPSLKNKIKDKLFQKFQFDKIKQDPFEEAIEGLYKRIEVNVPRGTNIIVITAYARSSESAAMMANTVAETYSLYANDLMSDKAKNAYNFIADKVEITRVELDEAKKMLENYMKLKKIASLTSLTTKRVLVEDKLTGLRQKEQQLQEEILKIDYQLSGKVTDNAKIKAVDVYQIQPNDTTRVIELKTRLKYLETNLSSLLRRYSNNYPDVIRTRRDVADLKEELSQSMNLNIDDDISVTTQLKNMRSNLEGKRFSLSKQIKNLELTIEELSKKEFVLAKLSRNMTSKENEYLGLDKTLENASLFLKGGEIKEGSIKILDAAFPPLYPNNKKKTVLLAIGFIVSIVFALGMAFIAEYRDKTFKNSDDVADFLNLPVLASIPIVAKKWKKKTS